MTAYLHALPPKLKIRVADGSNFSGVQFIVTGDYRPKAAARICLRIKGRFNIQLI